MKDEMEISLTVKVEDFEEQISNALMKKISETKRWQINAMAQKAVGQIVIETLQNMVKEGKLDIKRSEIMESFFQQYDRTIRYQIGNYVKEYLQIFFAQNEEKVFDVVTNKVARIQRNKNLKRILEELGENE